MSEPTTCPSCGAPIKVVSNTYIHEYVNHYEYVAPALPEDVRALKTFAEWALTEGPRYGCDLDGGDVQDRALMLGLLVEVEVAEPCGESCNCAEWDDFPQSCMRLAPWLLQRVEP